MSEVLTSRHQHTFHKVKLALPLARIETRTWLRHWEL